MADIFNVHAVDMNPAAQRPGLERVVAEYFAGIGLVRMGLEEAGWHIIYANDWSPKKFEMYRDFFPDKHDHYVVGDIFELDTDRIPRALLATCSFPCVDLSLAGNMNGLGGEHSSAFWGFVNILQAQGGNAPSIVMVENVPGWLHSNRGADFRVTVKALNEAGYACDVFSLNALSFTPQSRLRVFLIGVRHPGEPDATTQMLRRPASLLPSVMREALQENLDLNWYYNEIPAPPAPLREGLREIVEDIPDGDARWWTIEEVNRHLGMMEPMHRERVERLAAANVESYRTFYRRRRRGFQRAEVRNDELAGCLRTAIGGSGRQFVIAAGNNRIRMRGMTPREYARLQGVPDHFAINVEVVQALTGFGDAVCVPAIRWIGDNVLNPLAHSFEHQAVNV